MSGRARWALGWLAGLHAIVLAAGFLAPYPYDEQHREAAYAAPMGVHWSWSKPFGPYVYGSADQPGQRFAVRFLVHGRLFGVDPPGLIFLLGSDGYGRDEFSRVLYGGQVSLLTGLLAAALALALGVALGTAAGYFGGWVDGLLMRSGELVMAAPWLYLLLGVRALLPLHISAVETFGLLIAIIGGVGWVRPARVVRGVVLGARESGYVEAARGFGAGPWHVIRRHILPATLPVTATQATVLIPQYILAEVALSFLGFGVGEPVPSWGNMLSEARQYHSLLEHPWLLAPGLAAIPILLGYLTLADALADGGEG